MADYYRNTWWIEGPTAKVNAVLADIFGDAQDPFTTNGGPYELLPDDESFPNLIDGEVTIDVTIGHDTTSAALAFSAAADNGETLLQQLRTHHPDVTMDGAVYVPMTY